MFTTTLILCAGLALQATPAQDSDLQIQKKLDAARFTYTAPTVRLMTAEKAQALAMDLTEVSGGRLETMPAVATDSDLLYRGELDRSALLHVDMKTGGFVFSRGFDGMRGDTSTPGLPQKDTAADVATDVLSALNLLPAGLGQEVVVEHVGGVNMGVHNEDGTTHDFEKLVTVRFGRVLDGIPVQGRGSRMVVNLAEQGRLFGLVHRWQPFQAEPIQAAEKLTVDEVRELAARRIQIGGADAQDIAIESVELVLFDDGQGVMEPALHVVTQKTIETKSFDETGAEITETIQNPFDFYVPVLRDSKAQFPFRSDLEQRSIARPMNDR